MFLVFLLQIKYTMDDKIDLQGLENDLGIKGKLLSFHESINNMESTLDFFLKEDLRKDLSLIDQLNYDLFVAYMLNTLYWCYLRSKGLDPNTNKVKEEIARIKKYMLSAKEAIERHTIRKTVNVPVAQRYIKHGIQKMDSGKRKHDEKLADEDAGTPRKQTKQTK